MDIAPIIRENLTMKQELAKVKDELAKLKNDYTHLDKKYKELLILPKDSFNLDQFKANYLTTAFDEDTMPKVGGIYAYYNQKSQLLYIGQSVNMGNRLKQHFRNGKIKVNGHDSEFSSKDGWSFYVLEYIDRNDKKKLDEREAYWIAMGKVATSDKTVIDQSQMKEFSKRLKNRESSLDLTVTKKIKQKGNLTNRTRGNNVKM